MKGKEFLRAVLISTILMLACAPAYAAEVVKLYFEVSSDTATVWPAEQDSDYLRGRVVLLDANNQLGTTFNGVAIDQAQVIISSTNFSTSALFSDEPSTKLTFAAGDWDATGSVTIPIANAWQEFAVSYDDARSFGIDIIVATLKQSTAALSAQAQVTVNPPVANCYVLRTGGGLSIPGLLEELPSQRESLGTKKNDGDATTLQIFAAFYRNGAYYFTTSLPAGAETATITGGDATTVTLVNGYAQASVAKKKVMTFRELDSVGGFSDLYTNGKKITFSAAPQKTVTRWAGTKTGDVNEEEQVIVAAADPKSDFFDAAGDTDDIECDTDVSTNCKDDTAKYIGRIATKITMVGLPINEVTKDGQHKESGYKAQSQNPGTSKVSPYDAFRLLPSPLKKPAGSFRVPGEAGKTYIYGAIVGLDDDNNPAAFANNEKVAFSLYKEGGQPASEIEVISEFGDDEGDGVIKTKSTYQAFLPFRIRATAATADGSIASVTNLFIGSADAVSSALFSGIDEEAEGIDFIAQDTIASIDVTDFSSLNGKTAGSDAEVVITGKGEERSFEMWAVASGAVGSTADACKLGPKGSSTPLDSISIPNASGNTAEEDVAFFYFLGTNLFFVFKGDDLDTHVVKYYPEGSDKITAFYAADAGDFEPQSISSSFGEVSVILDQEENHNTVALTKIIEAKDIFSNTYGKTSTALPDADLSGKVYLPADAAATTLKASETLFPGASVKIKGDVETIGSIVEIGFNLSSITGSQDSGVLKLATKQGNVTAEVGLRLRAVTQVNLENIFVPMPGVSDTPIAVSLNDQNGDMTAPVVKFNGGNAIDIGLSVDNGTLRGVSASTTVSSSAPRKVFGADPDAGTSSMGVTAETDNYGTATLALIFVPDFDLPTVGEITAENCSAAIELFDNQDIDVAGTELIIYDSSGTDITDTLQRTDSDNGATGTIRLTGFVASEADDPSPEALLARVTSSSDDPTPAADQPAGSSYTAVIVARDIWKNERSISRSFDVPCVPATCGSVTPSYGVQGEILEITIEAEGSNFIDGDTEVVFSCDNATVDAVTVISPTELVVAVTISSSAPEPTSASLMRVASTADDQTPNDGDDADDGQEVNGALLCDITITSGSETPITCSDAFKIYQEAPEPKCLSITPSVVEGGTATTIVITGEGTSFNENTEVTFDCADITVASVTVDGDTQLTVEVVTVADPATNTCTILVDDLTCGVVSIAGESTECQLASIMPQSGRPGLFLPRFHVAVITGARSCSFGVRPEIDFASDDVVATPLLALGNTVICIVRINPGTPAGSYEVTVNGSGGVKFEVK